MKKGKHRQQHSAGPRGAATAVRPAADPEALARRVESALARGEVDTACQLLSQARPSTGGSLDAELGARAFALQAHQRWDKPARAIGSLERAIEWAPESAELRRLHSALLRRAGSKKRALTEMTEARRLAPEDPRIAYETLLTRLAAGDQGADLPALTAGLGGPEAQRAAALLAALDGDLASAERVVSDPEQPVDQPVHGLLLLARGKAREALPSLEKSAAAGALPRAARAFASLYLGIARMRLKQLAPAAEALEASLALGAPESKVQAQLAWVYQQLAIDAVLEGSLSEAADRFARLGKLGGPEAAQAHGNTAYALGLLGQERARKEGYEGAVSVWSRALSITPDDAVLRQNLAVALERAGRADEAIPHWQELVRQMPAGKWIQRTGEGGSAEEQELARHVRAVAHRHLADLYQEEVETERAIDQLEIAVRTVPEDLDTRRGLASLLMDEGQARKAASHYQQVVAAAPESVEDRLELGLALQATGDDQRGIEQMERALELQSDNPLVRSSLGLALSQRASRSPKADTALDDARRAVEMLPPTHAGLGSVAMGAAQLARDDRQGAQKSFKLAIRKAPVKALAAIKVGEAYWQAGERDAAVASWTDAMKRARRSPAAYPELAVAWAMAGDADRCRESLQAALKRPMLILDAFAAVGRISASRKMQPFLREVLRSVAASVDRPLLRVLLAKMMVYAGDAQGAGALLSQAALQAVEEDNSLLITPILDLDLKYRLLDRKATLALREWLDLGGY